MGAAAGAAAAPRARFGAGERRGSVGRRDVRSGTAGRERGRRAASASRREPVRGRAFRTGARRPPPRRAHVRGSLPCRRRADAPAFPGRGHRAHCPAAAPGSRRRKNRSRGAAREGRLRGRPRHGHPVPGQGGPPREGKGGPTQTVRASAAGRRHPRQTGDDRPRGQRPACGVGTVPGPHRRYPPPQLRRPHGADDRGRIRPQHSATHRPRLRGRAAAG